MHSTYPPPRSNNHTNGSRPEPPPKPLVSLVVCAYNEAPIVERNLAILGQYMDSLAEEYCWELIFINDGSTDNTGSLAEAFAQPQECVAVNWLALATFAGRFLPTGPGLLLDIGSTTSDLVPLQDGRPRPAAPLSGLPTDSPTRSGPVRRAAAPRRGRYVRGPGTRRGRGRAPLPPWSGLR